MIGWYHRLNGCEFKQAPGGGEGQRSLVCCSPWGLKESDTTERLNNNLRERNYSGEGNKGGIHAGESCPHSGGKAASASGHGSDWS